MTDLMIMRRVAMARLEAALINVGLSNHDKVAVRIAQGNDPEEVQKALAAKCGIMTGEDNNLLRNNMVTLEGLHGNPDEVTHAVALAAVVDVPTEVHEALGLIQAELKASNKKRKKDGRPDLKYGWTLMASQNHKSKTGVTLRINTPSQLKKLKAARHAEVLSKALGVQIAIEESQVSRQHVDFDRWAAKSHGQIGCGMAIGNAVGSGTVTMPVKYKKDRIEKSDADLTYEHLFLTAGHCFYTPGSSLMGQAIYQPPEDRNQERNIGSIVDAEYSPRYKGQMLIDAVLVGSRLPPSQIFGENGRQIKGFWDGEVTDETRSYLYGARSGYKSVVIENNGDTIESTLTEDGNNIIYRDMITILDTDKGKSPPTRSGDSGASLVVRKGDDLYMLGMIVLGPRKKDNYLSSRSFAVPIERVLNRFGVKWL